MSRPNPRNLVLGWRSALPRALLSAPGWAGPGNLVTDYLGQTATNLATTTAAPITATWPGPEVFDLVGLVGHNLSTQATVRIDLLLQGALVYSTGVVDAWPTWPWGSIPFPDARWWGHSLSPEDIAGLPGMWSHLLPDPVYADQLVLTVVDPANAQGFLDLPIFWAGPALQVSYNYEYGSQDAWHEAGEVDGADLGAPSTDVDGEPRVFRCTLPYLDHDEAIAQLGDLVRYAGRGRRPFLCLPDPGDEANLHRRSLWGFLPGLPPLEAARDRRRRVSLEIREWRA